MKRLLDSLAIGLFWCFLFNTLQAQETINKSRYSAILVKDVLQAEELIKRLEGGADFGELARLYSTGPNAADGGDLGFFAPGDMDSMLEKAVEKLSVNEYTPPIALSYGYYILKKTEVKEFVLPSVPFYSTPYFYFFLLLFITSVIAGVIYLRKPVETDVEFTREYSDVPSPDLSAAMLAGMLSSLLGASFWALLTIITEYQIGYVAIGVGAFVGFTVRYWGNGRSFQFGLIGGVFALFGCFIGSFFIVCYYSAQLLNMPFMEFVLSNETRYLWANMQDWIDAYDIAFYTLAAVAGYKIAGEEKDEPADEEPDGNTEDEVVENKDLSQS